MFFCYQPKFFQSCHLRFEHLACRRGSCKLDQWRGSGGEVLINFVLFVWLSPIDSVTLCDGRFQNKSVLELGSGCGLSGIFLCLRSTCKQDHSFFNCCSFQMGQCATRCSPYGSRRSTRVILHKIAGCEIFQELGAQCHKELKSKHASLICIPFGKYDWPLPIP